MRNVQIPRRYGSRKAEQLPTLGLHVGDALPHVKDKLREYLTL